MRLLDAIGLQSGEVVAVIGSGGKSTVIERLKDEAPGDGLTLIELHSEPVPENATRLLVVAGVDVMGEPPTLSVTAEQLASALSEPVGRPAEIRVAYVLNKADDELRLQQAKQVSALLDGTTVITVDGFVIWPTEEDGQ